MNTGSYRGLGRGLVAALALVLVIQFPTRQPLALASEAVALKGSWKPFRRLPPTSGRLPTYAELVQLPLADRALVLRSFRDFLVETEAEALSESGERASAVLDFWISSALAGARTPDFCINVGVVKPLDQCSPQGSPKMHDFDTTEMLKPIGADVVDCGGKGIPCSPVFGFDSSGKLFCTDTNRTRSCAGMARGSGTIAFAAVIEKCGTLQPGEKPEKPAVDCAQLKAFYDGQVELVQKHCAKSPARRACGILRRQLAHLGGKPSSASDVSVEEAADKAEEVRRAVTQGPVSADCDEAGNPAGTPSARHPGQKCPKTQFPTKEKPIFADVANALGKARKGAPCGDIEIPGGGIVHFDEAGVTYRVGSGGKGHGVRISESDAPYVNLASEVMAQQAGSPEQMVSGYMPVSEIGDTGEMQVPVGADGKVNKFPSRGWKTAAGTTLRFSAPSQGKEPSSRVIHLGIRKDGKEEIYEIPLASEEPAPKE